MTERLDLTVGSDPLDALDWCRQQGLRAALAPTLPGAHRYALLAQLEPGDQVHLALAGDSLLIADLQRRDDDVPTGAVYLGPLRDQLVYLIPGGAA